MEPSAPRHLKLGDPVNGTVVKAKGGNRFVVQSKDVPRGWAVELHTNRPELVELGSHTTFWVARVTPIKSEVLVRNGDHGRMPISPVMAERYCEAIAGLLGSEELTGERIGDARAMVARIGNQNQADWLTVWRLLGEPNSGEVKTLLNAIDEIRTARKEVPELVPALLENLVLQFGSSLEGALGRLRSTYGAA